MIAYYNNTTGALRLFSSIEGENLSGMTAVALPADYDEQCHVWDAETHAFTLDWTRVNADLHAMIDTGAGEFRKLFISSIAGQDATYLIKEREARAWEPGVSDAADFPYLREESTRLGTAINDLAITVKATADSWGAINPKIEGERVAAKARVTSATTLAAKQAAAAIDWAGVIS